MIEEIGRVREELGWPIVMTPFAQIVMTQAVMNVTTKERYKVIPDEAIRYALGRFGRPNVPIAAMVMERIESLPRTRELRAGTRHALHCGTAPASGREPVRRGIPAARHHARRPGRCHAGGGPRAAALQSGTANR